MRLPIGQRRSTLRFNITPLIDVVFQLIIFFLVASHFVRSETAEAVDLPPATQSENEDENPRTLTVTITPDEVLHVHGREVTPGELDQMILAGAAEHAGRFEVRVRGDRRVPYRVVEPILVACARAGVTDLKFAVQISGR
ncbi:MAG TPA: biopolymer transporter ExbD [Planctomycetaceae bacterium]|nr:biopolymer transporter ExbD [Planctomycetaceae bacterium]